MKVALFTRSQKTESTMRRVSLEISMKRFFEVDISSFSSIKNFLISPIEFDIIFVDDKIEDRRSFETAKIIRGRYPDTAIVLFSDSASEVYNAFSVKAYRFLVKPLDPQEITEAIESFRREQFSYKMIIAKMQNAFRSFGTDEIICVEADKKGCTIYTGEGPIHSFTPFIQVVEQLPEEYFYAVHRSFVVNMMYIHSFTQYAVNLKSGFEVPISRRRKMNFFIKYNEFTKSHNFYN